MALTVKLIEPTGVVVLVVMVRVDVLSVLVGIKCTGFGEKEALTPVGSAVVIARFASNAPGLPDPLPRLTVTV